MRVGPYEIAGPLGAGGMGEVYRAHDSRLGRDVAVKVLRADAIAPGDRHRFEIEARAASSLNHPNIVTIYDIGEDSGRPYIVSEYLDGESLRAAIPVGGLGLRKLLDIAIQIAAGLAAAHAGQITHRDLKPENIIVLRDGRVKILDFGLAKPAITRYSDDDTHTAEGVAVGTLAYMSPEQAQGEHVDYRSDQFSFGSVLFEMATGKRPFARNDRVSTLTAIVKEEAPSLSVLNPLIPAPLRWIVDRCLAKDPNQRYAATADLYQQLRDLREHLSEVSSSDAAAGLAVSRPWLPAWTRWALAVAGVAACAAAAAIFFSRPAELTGSLVFTPFATDADDETDPEWSSDGKAIAYSRITNGVSQIYARSLDSSSPAPLTNSNSDCRYPFWSADGSRIFYWSANSLWSVGSTGGTSQQVFADVPIAGPPATLSPDGKRIACFRMSRGHSSVYIMQLPAGPAVVYDTTPFPKSFRFPGGMRFSRDGSKLLVWMVLEVDAGAQLWVLPVANGTPRQVPVHLTRRFRTLTASWTADNRNVILATELTPGAGSHLLSLDTETGDTRALTSGTGEERNPSVSPDGERVAFASGAASSALYDVPIDGSRITILQNNSRHETTAEWAPNGKQYMFVSDAAGMPELWLRTPGESSTNRAIGNDENGHLQYAVPRFSPDAQRVAYVRIGSKHLVWISNLSGGTAVKLEEQSADQHSPAWSPDGEWIAYERYHGGKWQIAKAPSGGGGTPVSLTDGGFAGATLDWSPDGKWIAFSDPDHVYVVNSAGGDAWTVYDRGAAFAFSRDSSALYVISRGIDHNWQILRVPVKGGEPERSTALAIPAYESIGTCRMHPDGTRLLISAALWQRDIWILDGLNNRTNPFARWRKGNDAQHGY